MWILFLIWAWGSKIKFLFLADQVEWSEQFMLDTNLQAKSFAWLVSHVVVFFYTLRETTTFFYV